MKVVEIPWVPSEDGGPLGRNVEHDERSRAFGLVRRLGTRNPVLHKRHGRKLDQGSIGSCTGNALVGAVMTDPIYRTYHNYGEPRALIVYSRATWIDPFTGHWPPDDTGSSGLAACKAANEMGMIGPYHWAFGLDEALDALQVGPIMLGIEWLEGFDSPDARGLVKLTGQVRGGHEIVCRGYDPETNEIFCDNSWGEGWGLGGSFRMKVPDLGTLLDRDGDVAVPSRRA